MVTDFNGGQINTTVTDVDSLPLLLTPSLYCTIVVIRSTGSWPWCEAYKTYSRTKVLYPAALWAGVEEYASSLVYFVQPLPAALLYPNHHFLTPCYHFLVRALTPPTISPSLCSLCPDWSSTSSQQVFLGGISQQAAADASHPARNSG